MQKKSTPESYMLLAMVYMLLLMVASLSAVPHGHAEGERLAPEAIEGGPVEEFVFVDGSEC